VNADASINTVTNRALGSTVAIYLTGMTTAALPDRQQSNIGGSTGIIPSFAARRTFPA